MIDPTPEKSQNIVEQEFWDRHQNLCGSASQYKPLLEALVNRVRLVAKNETLDQWAYQKKLDEAGEVLEEVTTALKRFWKQPPIDRFWFGFHNFPFFERPQEWLDASPIDASSLDTATAKYLDRPWMQINRLDWYILNGFITDELLRFSEGIKSGAAMGGINWAYIFAGGKFLPSLFWQMGLTGVKFAGKWILLPTLSALAYFLGYNDVAKWVLGVFGVLVVFNIIFLPRHILIRKAQKQKVAELEDRLKRLIQIFQSSHASTLNPSHLKDRITQLEKGEVLVQPAVFSILDRAIARDPAVFTMDE